jgi:hypothetical protein
MSAAVAGVADRDDVRERVRAALCNVENVMDFEPVVAGTAANTPPTVAH